jgi:hypothetical protein
MRKCRFPLNFYLKYFIIGEELYGLSIAWELAEKPKKKGCNADRLITVLGKSSVDAEDFGIDCGIVRNSYY